MIGAGNNLGVPLVGISAAISCKALPEIVQPFEEVFPPDFA